MLTGSSSSSCLALRNYTFMSKDCVSFLPIMATQSDPVALSAPLSQWISDNLTSDFLSVVQLTMEESKKDPPEEPYRSLYNARELLSGIKAKLDVCPLDMKQTENFKILSSCVRLEMGLNFINTEEISSGEELLEECLRSLDGLPSKVKTACVCVQVYNQLGIMWGNRNEQQKALEVLLKAKAVYESHIVLPPPMTSTEWLEGKPVSENDREKTFENLHTLTLFYLAQVYGNLKQPKVSAQYCQNTLSRQLETQEYDAIEWSLNCVALSQYYLNVDHFAQSRHCIASASNVLEKYLTEHTLDSEEVVDSELSERLQGLKADISRCWIKYCLALLTSSEERQENESGFVDPPKRKLFRFDSLEVADVEASVTCELVESYASAKPVFQLGQKHVGLAAEYFTSDSFATDYVKIVQDHSRLFKLLAFFESSNELKCRMHKRRYDMLTAILDELNPRYYLTTCQQIMFEVGDIESTRADLKIISASESPTSHAVSKINKLIRSGIQFYEKFVASFEDPITHQLPDEIENNNLRPFLCAKLYIARLHSKIICADPSAQVSCLSSLFFSLSLTHSLSLTLLVFLNYKLTLT